MTQYLFNGKRLVPFLLCMFLMLPYQRLYAGAYNSVSFFVVAHPDDWQLFMGRHAREVAAISGRKLVFIYITAGDAGSGNNIKDHGLIPYFMAREYAAIKSTQFLCQSISDDSTPDSFGIAAVNGHKIVERHHKNTASYCLRLPDGGMDARGRLALKKLYKNYIPSLNSVENQNEYNGWQDLVKTISDIIARETDGITGIKEINMPDIADSRNGKDHIDHYLAGVLALSATKNSCFSNLLYQGYTIARQSSKLNNDEINFKRSLLRQIGVELGSDGYADCQDDGHVAFTKNENSLPEDACNAHDPSASFVRIHGYRQEDMSDSADISFTLYPNPSNSTLYLILSDHKEGLYRATIFDLQGNVNKTTAVQLDNKTSEMSVDITSLSPGQYLIRLSCDNMQSAAGFIKN